VKDKTLFLRFGLLQRRIPTHRLEEMLHRCTICVQEIQPCKESGLSKSDL
jgi:hypothetical protein